MRALTIIATATQKLKLKVPCTAREFVHSRAAMSMQERNGESEGDEGVGALPTPVYVTF